MLRLGREPRREPVERGPHSLVTSVVLSLARISGREEAGSREGRLG